MRNQYEREQRWELLRGVIHSSKGGELPGRGAINHGLSQLWDLMPNASHMQVLVLNVTGRLPEPRLAKWIEAVFVCCSWPDPRIWCNQIAALGGSARVSAMSAVCAANMSSDSAMFGPGTVDATCRFLYRVRAAVQNGLTIAEFIDTQVVRKGKLMAPGFVRPRTNGDDRVEVLFQLAEELDFQPGQFQRLVYAFDEQLASRCADRLNVGGFVNAFMLDQGYSPEEIERILTFLVGAGLLACYSEYRDQPPGDFLPLRCDDIDYVGTAQRPVPVG